MSTTSHRDQATHRARGVSQAPEGGAAIRTVWAPFAETVSLVLDGHHIPLSRTGDGWWTSGPVEDPIADYKFSLDGADPLPDPRSPWQPFGVHGPSRPVNHDSFSWTDQYWQAKPLSAALIYEVHLGTFTKEGTFDAAIERLDHLVDLGVTHVEIMPVAEFLGDYGWGYDGVCPFAPHHAFGGPDGLKRLVNACHAKGLGVLLDVVYNHLGPVGNYLHRFGPYFTEKHHTPWGAGLNFDGPHSDEVRRYFCDNALMWLRDYHFDGLRLDAVHAIADTSAVPFLEQLATEVDELKAHLGRHLILAAESDLNDPRVVRPWEMGGIGFDAQWSDDIHHSLHTVLTGEREGYYADFGSLEDLATSMTQPYVYSGRRSVVRQRQHGRPTVGLSAHRFVAFMQNHDQLGNRARGERMSHLVSLNRVKLGAALVLTSPYVPLLFQGEEWASTSPFQYFVDFGEEPQLAEAVAIGRRKEFESFTWAAEAIPDPNAKETFLRSKLDWSELDEPAHRDMLEWYRKLIALRRQFSTFTTGRLDIVAVQSDADREWLRVVRGPAAILCNFSTHPQEIPVERGSADKLLLASVPPLRLEPDAVTMAPESVAIFAGNSAVVN